MGPLLPLKNTADVIVWAHLSCLKMLPIILNGPTAATENTANVIVWAHLSCLKMLPIILNGPTAATEKYCRCYCMGPFKLPKNVAYNIEWAHCCH